ncbi:MAG: GNAT family N-acetyltransferase [Anaerolineaceae bacterium]|nr:GNAT family N-acetyltransferase [Anaerolineaceae bacterium]
MEESIRNTTDSEIAESIIIRPLQNTDLPALEWDGEYLHFRNVFADVYKKVEKGTVKAWVAVSQDGRMIGQVFLQLSSERRELADGWNRGYLYSLRVRKSWQNQGVGSRLMDVVEDDLRKIGFTRVTLNVARDNQGAVRLYSRLGYQIVAEEPGVWSYPDHEGVWRTVTEPSWRMEKRL